MAFKSGKDSFFSVDGTDISSYVDSLSLSRDVNTLETTSFGSDQATFVVGVEGLSISGSGSWDATNDGTMAGLFDGSQVAFEYRPDNTSSQPKYTGNAFVTNYTIDSSATDKISFSFSLIVTGAVTRGTV
jgi:predicted secreted protein|tara:strand:+ start:2041 stop:2430 length:390 start_codon:yes stop_codon:yes gene_type:complete